MRIKVLFSVFLLSFISSFTFGQTVVRGTITSAYNNEPVVKTLIKLDGNPVGRSDYEGNYSLQITEGTHTIIFSNTIEGFLDQEHVVAVSGEGVLVLDIEMRTAETGVVIVEVEKNSDEVINDDRNKEPAPVEILGNSEMQKQGVNTVDQAIAKIPGGSVDGNNVFIRGLGDRYTKSVLNGMEIPGLDPDRNSVQMDIFPTVMIDRVTVYKTFLPNLSGDFTGGLIDITTKEFPLTKTIYFKGGLGYNVNTTFNADYITYQGGKIDFLGFDDGFRALPFDPSIKIPHPSQGSPLTEQLTASFGRTMAAEKGMAFFNQNYSFGIGNQKDIHANDPDKKWSYGYNAFFNYRTWNNYFADAEFNEYRLDPDSSITEFSHNRNSKGEIATSDAMWTALLGQSFKKGTNKISVVLFHTQSGTKTTAVLTDRNFDLNQATLVKQGLSYQQRSISNLNISGLHYLDTNLHWKLNWKVAPTYSLIKDPDIRSTALQIAEYTDANGEPVYLWEESVGAELRRIFRNLNEYNLSGKIDLERTFKVKDSLKSTVSFGLLNTYKNRNFEVTDYTFKLYNTSNEVPNDPNWFFTDDNIYSTTSGSGLYGTGQQEPANQYSANQNISALYVMNDLPLNANLNLTYGVRTEYNMNRYTGLSNNAATDPNAPRYNNDVVLSKLSVLPSLNMVYRTNKKANADKGIKHDRSTNYRVAYTSTVARPSFREISISQIYDPIQGRRYLGNIDLKMTTIHNADFRWEYFFGAGEIISASVFYKKFINPIEVVANVAAPNEFKPVNAGQADIYGIEFEFRKGFNLNEASRLVLGANFAYILSRINMHDVQTIIGTDTLTEYDVRLANAREGQTIADYRPLYGQSPYIVNAFVRYQNDSIGLVCNLTYNVQGPKLAVIGVGAVPDVYELPLHSLNLKISKRFGSEEKERPWNVSVQANNLLNMAKRRYYVGYNAQNQTFDYFNQGRSFSASVSYTFSEKSF